MYSIFLISITFLKVLLIWFDNYVREAAALERIKGIQEMQIFKIQIYPAAFLDHRPFLILLFYTSQQLVIAAKSITYFIKEKQFFFYCVASLWEMSWKK